MISPAILLNSGRTLLGLYFLLAGLGKALNWQSTLALMQAHHIPWTSVLLAIALIANVILASALILNVHVKKAALAAVVYILIINYFMHDFWHFSGIKAAHETQNFIKNLGILAGFLILASHNQSR